ncbi:caa(3)-type oxidase, subunit IV [Porphyromonas uenonis 60-3]|uniref:Caa(3)-type oxidase, subunit IV n=1 Tax=Porphyromonas uenonis 60-3 TaxID=596327 RepID=C2MDP4_9PORP|nr:TrkH family potassium uptake protein [Porphyromonas uenonis]EEK16154.1 caa(3)-type oxidase, subunit IV [Porphyromonas uenonis 60-3]
MRRINLPFVGSIVGAMCLIECLFLLICIVVSLIMQDHAVAPLLITLGCALLVGLGCLWFGRLKYSDKLGRREAMLAVAVTWLVVALIGMLPFLVGGYLPRFSNALFESVSGFTTTGASTFTSVEHLPKGILFWRSIIQWQGGIGIVVFSLALSPVLGKDIGLLYQAEVTGVDHDRFMPRIKEVAIRLSAVYTLLTLVLIVLLRLTPIPWFDASCVAMTCISTGGFSIYDQPFEAINSPYFETILMLFMVIGSLNMTLIYFAFKGQIKQLFRDEQTRWFLGIIFVTASLVTLHLVLNSIQPHLGKALRDSFFQIVSLISTTGYLYADYTSWGPFFMLCGIFVMLICGCAGSTAGGLKVIRFVIMSKTLPKEIAHRVSPSLVAPLRINGKSVPDEAVYKVMGFFFGYIALIFLGTFCLTFTGNDFISASTASVSAIGNVGPAFGDYVFNFSSASPFDLIVLSFLMLAGRLELFTVLSLFAPAFWRR